MESTVSASKGIFNFSNGYKQNKSSKKKQKIQVEKSYTKDLWYKTFERNWDVIENQIKDLHHKTYSLLLNDIVNYVKLLKEDASVSMDNTIPSATLLTGVNQPDHVSQFQALIEKLREEVTPHIAMVNSQDASTLKHLVENAVWQLIHTHAVLDDYQDEEFEDISEQSQAKLKKYQCTMRALRNWYQTKYANSSPNKESQVLKKPLVIIIPDFESFNCNILQDFVMIVSSYVSSLPLVFVFGVATSVSALHKSFPYHVSSKLLIKVFQSHSSPEYMNRVLEDIFLTHTNPVHMSGKAVELLTDVFLFYDFSVSRLIDSIKFCMMEHYCGDNLKSLCCERHKLEEATFNLSSEDLESARQLLSVRPFFEAQDMQTKKALLLNDDIFRHVLYEEIDKLHDYMLSFYLCIRLLTVFVKDLPRNELGKTVREIYTKCTVENITSTHGFKECMQLLKFQSQFKLVESIKNALKLINSALETVFPVSPLRSPSKNNIHTQQLSIVVGENFMKIVRVHLLTFLRQIQHSNTESTIFNSKPTEIDHEMDHVQGNRYKLKEKLLQATREVRIQSEYEMVRSRFVSYLEDMFSIGLRPPSTQPFHEIFFFSDVASVKKLIVGAPRGALHTALSNSVHYLQCSCCHLPSSESIVDTLPDICIAYKLHLECGKHINLYDWLQAFAAVLRPDDDDEQRHQDTSVQDRFRRAEAELQFLGFIKVSKRKIDHVMRLTW